MKEHSIIRQLPLILVICCVFLAMTVFVVLYVIQYSTKRAIVTVPDIHGKTTAEALKVLDEVGLLLAYDGEEYSSEYEKGQIMSQDPEPGQKVKVMRRIRVLLSRGLKKIIVPPLANLNIKQIDHALANIKLLPGAIVKVHHNSVPDDHVITTYPPPSHPVSEGDEVDVLVSLGQQKWYTMPDIIGLKLPEAITILRKIDLSISELNDRYDNNLEENIILAQEPLYGSRITSKASIRVTVSRHADELLQTPQKRFRIIKYRLPESLEQGQVKIILVDGEKEEQVADKTMVAGEELKMPLQLGVGTTVRILLNGKVVDERKY